MASAKSEESREGVPLTHLDEPLFDDSDATKRDVTEVLQKQVRDFPVINLQSSSYNKSFGGDPAPNSPKQLVVEYRIDGKAGKATFDENTVIMLPTPE